jgi:glycosyltransferase involved in cell wall biosynthesis
MPKVSVIIPTRNRAELLRKSIHSVLQQTYHNYEIIVVDDASADHTLSTLESFNDGRIIYLHHETSKGGSVARNTGICHARGEYIAFLDDDDEWLPTKLEKQIKKFEDGPLSLGVVYTDMVYIDTQTGHIIGAETKRHRGWIHDDLLNRSTGPRTSSAMVRKELLSRIGMFDETLTCAQEPDLWIRLSEHCEFDYIDECLVRVRFTHDRISTNPQAQIIGRERFLAKHGAKLSSPYKAGQLCKLGNAYCQVGQMRKGRQALIRAIGCKPWSFSYYFFYLGSLLPSSAYNDARRWKKAFERFVTSHCPTKEVASN